MLNILENLEPSTERNFEPIGWCIDLVAVNTNDLSQIYGYDILNFISGSVLRNTKRNYNREQDQCNASAIPPIPSLNIDQWTNEAARDWIFH